MTPYWRGSSPPWPRDPRLTRPTRKTTHNQKATTPHHGEHTHLDGNSRASSRRRPHTCRCDHDRQHRPVQRMAHRHRTRLRRRRLRGYGDQHPPRTAPPPDRATLRPPRPRLHPASRHRDHQHRADRAPPDPDQGRNDRRSWSEYPGQPRPPVHPRRPRPDHHPNFRRARDKHPHAVREMAEDPHRHHRRFRRPHGPRPGLARLVGDHDRTRARDARALRRARPGQPRHPTHRQSPRRHPLHRH